MTTGEGGAVITSTAELGERIRRLRGHGLTSGTFERHSGCTWGYDVTMLGYNYRMDELRAALGLVQLKKLQDWNQKRKVLTEAYRMLLKESAPEIGVPFANCDSPSAYHIMPIVLPEWADRASVVRELRDAGIQTSFHYPPIHQFSMYRQRLPRGERLKNTETMASRELTLPLHPKLGIAQLERITTVLHDSLASEYVSA
jgi:dTDP-4-amino-4,6-dideoxygalactose transaminase